MTGIPEQLKWESLNKKRKDSRLITLYEVLKGTDSIPTNDLVPPIRGIRNRHSRAFQTPLAGTDIYKSSFFPPPPPVYKKLELPDIFPYLCSGCAEDSVTKFTSLVNSDSDR